MSGEKEYEIDLKELIEMLLRRWWIIFSGIIIFGTIGIGIALTSTKIYESSATLMVGNNNMAQYNSLDSSQVQLNKDLVSTYQEIAVSSNVLNVVISTLNLEISPKALAGQIKVSNINDTEIIRISAMSPVPEVAQEIANTTATVFKDKVQEIMNVDNVKIVDPAVLPQSPVKPNKKLILAASLFLGLVLSVGLIFVIEFFDKRIKNLEFFEKELNLPILATIFDSKEYKKVDEEGKK
ncbi:MAG: Wzz/FepE/Etk N-terminal domain-containing protein [Fusobacteria bacterium]|nr:Wzz/FepE/Etk N-terminal domain-containing protein [Fusobacteriota bacterium]